MYQTYKRNACDTITQSRKKYYCCLSLPDHLDIATVIALGKPKEVVVIEKLDESGEVKYWRDQQGVHHVPKRALEDLIYTL